MKRINQFSFLLIAILLWQNSFAQKISPPPEANYQLDITSYEFDEAFYEYYQGMNLFILDKSAEPMPAELKEQLEISKVDSPNLSKAGVVEIIRDYWKFEYINRNPMPNSPAVNPSREEGDAICDNGGFENDFNGYDRYRSVFNNHFPKCNPMYIGNPLVWEYLPPIPATYPLDYPYDMKIMSPGLDPNIPVSFNLDQVRFGDHSLKINEVVANSNVDCGRGLRGIDRLTKEFTVDEAHERFAVWYATVLQDPEDHLTHNDNDKPFFNIQFFDAQNVLVDELCWDSTEDFFIDHPTNRISCGNEPDNHPIRFQPWSCTIFDFSGYEGQELRMELIAADCGRTGHFGYAYVDGICDYCATIELTADVVECATLPYEVSGNISIVDSDISNLELINLEGVLVGDDGSEFTFDITSTVVNGNFNLIIDPSWVTLGVCYDFYVRGIFQNGNDDPFTIRSATLITGAFNDFCGLDLLEARLDYTYSVECIDIGHPRNITNDQFKLTLDVLTNRPDVEWEIIRNGYDVVASGTGSQTVVLGPYRYQDCDYFEIYDPFCDQTHFINIEYDCDDCVNAFRICEHEIICDDRGTPDPSDDQWSITWVVESESGVGNWQINNPTFIGNYNQVTTIPMGELNNYGDSHVFKVFDPVTRCILVYKVELPESCRPPCNSVCEVVVSDCMANPNPLGNQKDFVYEVTVFCPGLTDCIPQFFRKIGPGDYLPIPILAPNGGRISLGIFNVGAGPWTLLIIDCDGCQREMVIFPPDCERTGGGGIGTGRSLKQSAVGFEIAPNPTTDILNISLPGAEQVFDLYLINMHGQRVMQIKNSIGEEQMDLSSLSSGVYHLVAASNGEVVMVERVVKI